MLEILWRILSELLTPSSYMFCRHLPSQSQRIGWIFSVTVLFWTLEIWCFLVFFLRKSLFNSFHNIICTHKKQIFAIAQIFCRNLIFRWTKNESPKFDVFYVERTKHDPRNDKNDALRNELACKIWRTIIPNVRISLNEGCLTSPSGIFPKIVSLTSNVSKSFHKVDRTN